MKKLLIVGHISEERKTILRNAGYTLVFQDSKKEIKGMSYNTVFVNECVSVTSGDFKTIKKRRK